MEISTFSIRTICINNVINILANKWEIYIKHKDKEE